MKTERLVSLGTGLVALTIAVIAVIAVVQSFLWFSQPMPTIRTVVLSSPQDFCDLPRQMDKAGPFRISTPSLRVHPGLVHVLDELGELDDAYDWRGPLSSTELESELAELDVEIRSEGARTRRLLSGAKQSLSDVAEQVSYIEQSIQRSKLQQSMLVAGDVWLLDAKGSARVQGLTNFVPGFADEVQLVQRSIQRRGETVHLLLFIPRAAHRQLFQRRRTGK